MEAYYTFEYAKAEPMSYKKFLTDKTDIPYHEELEDMDGYIVCEYRGCEEEIYWMNKKQFENSFFIVKDTKMRRKILK